jgi:GR25 family glycosyltransferase involved in LPS biosynthesis
MPHLWNELFDGVYCLNLAAREDRWIGMSRKFRFFDLRVERINALPGKLVTGYWEILSKQHDYHTNHNNLACAISHVSMWNTALATGKKNALFLEDDIRIHRNSEQMTRNFMKLVPDDWDLLYFGYVPLISNDYRKYDTTHNLNMWDYNILEQTRLGPNTIKADRLWNCSGYALSEKLMRHMVDVYAKSYPKEHDRYLVENIQTSAEWKSYGSNPQIVAGEDSFSDLIGGLSDGHSDRSVDSRFVKYHDYV